MLIYRRAQKKNHPVQSTVFNECKMFLKSMRKHLPNGNPLHKIFNQNMLKVSCSCTGNMASIISSHNRTILNPDASIEYGYNCRSRNECSLQNKWFTPKLKTT